MQSILTQRRSRYAIDNGTAQLPARRVESIRPSLPTNSEIDRFDAWESRVPELKQLAEPLLDSYAFKRLSSITFLGLLSPNFASLAESPIHRLKSRLDLTNDGSRYGHSLGVACLLLDLSRDLDLKLETQRYAVAWGLLHDVATWALSHTGEVAFATATRTASRQLREMILLGDRKLPALLTVRSQLTEIGVDPQQLVDLFRPDSVPANAELRILLEILRSPITPDSLEGIWRSGTAIGLKVPRPSDVKRAITRDLFGLRLDKEHYRTAISFWRTKSRLYRRYINHIKTINWESTWSAAILARYRHAGLVESMFLGECEILANVDPMHTFRDLNVTRYKPPLDYYVDGSTRFLTKSDLPFSILGSLLRKKLNRVNMMSLPE